MCSPNLLPGLERSYPPSMKVKFNSPQTPDRFSESGVVFSPRTKTSLPDSTFNVKTKVTNYSTNSPDFSQYDGIVIYLDGSYEELTFGFKAQWEAKLPQYNQATPCGCDHTPMDAKKLYRTTNLNRSYLGLPHTDLPPPDVPWLEIIVFALFKIPAHLGVPNTTVVIYTTIDQNAWVIFSLGGELGRTPTAIPGSGLPCEIPDTTPLGAFLWSIPSGTKVGWCTFLSNAIASASGFALIT